MPLFYVPKYGRGRVTRVGLKKTLYRLNNNIIIITVVCRYSFELVHRKHARFEIRTNIRGIYAPTAFDDFRFEINRHPLE